MILKRGTIVNRTYGTHKILYISLFLLTIFGPDYNASTPQQQSVATRILNLPMSIPFIATTTSQVSS